VDEALRLDRISKGLGARVLMRDVTLRAVAGEALALVGPSGSGKTTLLRIIAGLDVPDAGDVWIAGQQATRERAILVPPDKRRIGFVFQDLALWPHMTVAQSLDFVLTSAAGSVNRVERLHTIEETLTLVQIDGLGDRYPHQLSGGEQQRAAFARALVHRPPLLLLDEPFSSLDADLRQDMRTSLSDLRQRLGFAMVFVTHDRAEATAVADRTIIPGDFAHDSHTGKATRSET
jgi:ABC-type Fe3+/spermidine/putrescine transport system ATPase subunit